MGEAVILPDGSVKPIYGTPSGHVVRIWFRGITSGAGQHSFMQVKSPEDFSIPRNTTVEVGPYPAGTHIEFWLSDDPVLSNLGGRCDTFSATDPDEGFWRMGWETNNLSFRDYNEYLVDVTWLMPGGWTVGYVGLGGSW